MPFLAKFGIVVTIVYVLIVVNERLKKRSAARTLLDKYRNRADGEALYLWNSERKIK